MAYQCPGGSSDADYLAEASRLLECAESELSLAVFFLRAGGVSGRALASDARSLRAHLGALEEEVQRSLAVDPE